MSARLSKGGLASRGEAAARGAEPASGPLGGAFADLDLEAARSIIAIIPGVDIGVGTHERRVIDVGAVKSA